VITPISIVLFQLQKIESISSISLTRPLVALQSLALDYLNVYALLCLHSVISSQWGRDYNKRHTLV